MKKVLIFFWLCVLPMASLAESGVEIEHADADAFNQLSVIRGAGYFGQYCLGCHGLKQIRYSRISKDLRVNETVMRDLILLGDAKIYDVVRSAMPVDSATLAFGVAPPDLSLVTRSRGANWVYTYLKSFYEDPKRPFGVNNALLPNVAMPNVLWELQGPQAAIEERVDGKLKVVGVESHGQGKLNERQFDQVANDLVNFLSYVSEPSILQRVPLGKYVIAFLLFLTYLFYRLKKEYWKDID